MKTIYTTLPIYDKLSKQRYERSRRVSGDKAMLHPTITPRHRLPAFQWQDGGDGAASVSRIEFIDIDGNNSNNGTVYFSWLNDGFVTLTTNGLDITQAISNNILHRANTLQSYTGLAGDNIIVIGNFTLTSGQSPHIMLFRTSDGSNQDITDLIEGKQTYTLTLPTDDTYQIRIGYTPLPGASNFSFTDVTIKCHAFNNVFPTLPSLYTDGTTTWFTYEGDTLNYLLPEGLYYLKITMDTGAIYYSDWFLVDCVFENLITEWANSMYNSFTSSGTTITGVTSGIAGGNAASDSFNLIAGEKVTLIFYLAHPYSPSENPSFTLYDYVTFHEETHVASAGLNVIEFTALGSNSYCITITNTTNSQWMTSEVMLIRAYSEKYLIVDFEHSCNLGDINYESGFEQTLYLESEPLESAFPYVEKGAENGYGRFVPTYQRQDKTYIIRTKLVADYIIDVLHRLKLHDTIFLTDLVGDVWDVEEIDTEQTWQFDDKYYALATITVDLGEGIAITGCCTAINEC